jgi:hypothetical protein
VVTYGEVEGIEGIVTSGTLSLQDKEGESDEYQSRVTAEPCCRVQLLPRKTREKNQLKNRAYLDGLEKGNASENFGERGPQEDLGHAAGLDQHIVGRDGHDLS